MNAIDAVAHTNAWSGRHPGEKVLLGGGLLLLSLILPPWPGAALVILAAGLAAVCGARIRPLELVRVLLLPFAFLASGAAMLTVSLDLEAAVPAVRLASDGVDQAANVSLRALAATSATMLIVLTTPLPALILLSQRLRLPEPLIDLAFLTYRFAGLSVAMAATGRRAQRNRQGDSGFTTSLRSTGLLVATLLPRILARAQRLQAGLAARGYDGAFHTLAPTPAFSPRFAGLSVAVFAAIAAVASWFGVAAS